MKKNSNCVCIFAYNKRKCLQNLLSSLKNIKDFEQVDILIFQDAPLDAKIQEIIVNFIKIFPNAKYIPRDQNYGLKRNILLGLEYCSKHYNKVIVLEDDLLVSQNLLNSLDIDENYLQENSIAQVSLYAWTINDNTGTSFYPVHFGYDAYFTKIPVSWGFWMTSKMIDDFLCFYEKNQTIDDTILSQLPAQCRVWVGKSWKLHLWAFIISKQQYVLNFVSGYCTVSAIEGGSNQSVSNIFATELNRNDVTKGIILPSFSPIDWFYDQWFEVDGHLFRERSGLDNDVVINLYNSKPHHILNNNDVVSPINYEIQAQAEYGGHTIPHEMSLIESIDTYDKSSFYLSKFNSKKHNILKLNVEYVRGNIFHRRFFMNYFVLFLRKIIKK